MRTYAGWLFGLAAVANVAVAGAILFARASFVSLLGLDPISGTNAVFAELAAILIAAFGYGYARIAVDPTRFRPLIHIGAAGKLAAVAATLLAAVVDRHALRLAVLLGGDAVFAGLFLDYLRRT